MTHEEKLEIAELLDDIDQRFVASPKAEITIEANPGSMEPAKLRSLVKAGVNRISIGVQSFLERDLKALGRGHSPAQAREAIAQLSGAIDVSAQAPRVGVFVCRCGINIANVVDVPTVVEYAKTLPHVAYVEENLFTCSQDTQDKMAEVIAEPREELSPFAPRITTIHVDPDKIGKIIGPGGKMIRKIQEECEVDVDIEDDGTVYIAAIDGLGAKKAIAMVEALTEPTASDSTMAELVAITLANRADATWTLTPKHEWDVAAGAALMRASGGRIALPDGSPPTWNNPEPLIPGLVATSPAVADDTARLLDIRAGS